jgi:hypothetical protein
MIQDVLNILLGFIMGYFLGVALGRSNPKEDILKLEYLRGFADGKKEMS